MPYSFVISTYSRISRLSSSGVRRRLAKFRIAVRRYCTLSVAGARLSRNVRRRTTEACRRRRRCALPNPVTCLGVLQELNILNWAISHPLVDMHCVKLARAMLQHIGSKTGPMYNQHNETTPALVKTTQPHPDGRFSPQFPAGSQP